MKLSTKILLSAAVLGIVGNYLLKNYDFSYTNSSVNATSRKNNIFVNHNFKAHRSEVRAGKGGLEGKIGYNHDTKQANGQMNWKEYTLAALFDTRYKIFSGSMHYTPMRV